MQTTRINLNERAAGELAAMVEQVKKEGECVKVSPSALASWIVSHFFGSSFEKRKGEIVEAHFDRRAYLKGLVRSDRTDEEVEGAIRRILTKNTPKRGKK